MPIVARHSVARHSVARRPVAGRTTAREWRGALGPARPTAPARALAAEARGLIRRLADPGGIPAAWSEPAYVREVVLVRAHLAPIRSRAGLAASYGREAFHALATHRAAASAAPDTSPDGESAPGPVRAAYAIRWLELGDGVPRPPWPKIQAPPGSLSAA